MFFTICFALVGTVLLLGTFFMLRSMWAENDQELKVSDFPVMGFGLIVGGLLSFLGYGGIFLELFDEKPANQNQVRVISEEEKAAKEKEKRANEIAKIRLLLKEGVETTAWFSADLQFERNEFRIPGRPKYIHSRPQDIVGHSVTTTRTDKYEYFVDGKPYQLVFTSTSASVGLRSALPKDSEASVVYLPSDPNIALVGTKRLLEESLRLRLEETGMDPTQSFP